MTIEVTTEVTTGHSTTRRGVAVDEVWEELSKATKRFPPMNSAHEGFAVIAEELDELWDEVRGKQGARDVERMRKEAVQVAAMAIRFIVDVCDGERGQR